MGNFLGDFVKGNHYTWLPEEIQTGVKLHRKVDVFTDSHESITALKRAFPKQIRRMSGVCIDIWFDHLLLIEEQHFDAAGDDGLFDAFYKELADFDIGKLWFRSSGSSPSKHSPLNPSLFDGRAFNESNFESVRTGLLTHRWLANYREPRTCLDAFISVEARLGHKIIFARPAFDFIIDNEAEFMRVFQDFYPQLMEHARQQIKTINQS